MHAPALGQLLAEIICDGRATTLDVACLDPGRFEAGSERSTGVGAAVGLTGAARERHARHLSEERHRGRDIRVSLGGCTAAATDPSLRSG